MLLVCLHHPSGRSLSFWWLCLQWALCLLKYFWHCRGCSDAHFSIVGDIPVTARCCRRRIPVPWDVSHASVHQLVVWCDSGPRLCSRVSCERLWYSSVFNIVIGNLFFFFFSHHGFKLWVHILWFDTLAVPWCFFYVIDWNLLLMKSLWAVPLVSLKWTLQSRPLTAAGSTRRLLQEKAACTTCTLQLAQSEQGRKQLTDHLCFLY